MWAFIVGLVIGVIAKWLMPGKDPGGFIITGLLGVAGSLTATWLGQAIGLYRPGQAAGFLFSVIGAMLLLGLYRAFAKKEG
ncbi:GlsB/YeaQ/YmgE family stress response membrane protein [Tahibacter amnicola]|uniref:GlsB/YeaQ/YmgE family stress response membrane protein n=1 Tax=Tahibacter amnicola TaxID=2976241 RepID=A0ABY6BMN2_9GAMM|nr:GlsB/YeaQ/YmgE family stress response membrane protein [Tahibacter amnicola]UXI70738.1 GlsB/YeaQ/YmgE family stress response membrane protein [Tahibacter amnicola]